MADCADTPSDKSAEGTEGGSRVARCQTCGSRINQAESHPVTTATDDDGEFHLYSFCSNDCWNEWKSD
jgi:hypothetical protein